MQNLRQLLATRARQADVDFSSVLHDLVPHGIRIMDQSLIKDVIPADNLEWWDQVYDRSLVDLDTLHKIQRQVLIDGAINIFNQRGLRERMVDPARNYLRPEFIDQGVVHGIIERRFVELLNLIPWFSFETEDLLHYIKFALSCGHVRLAEFLLAYNVKIAPEDYSKARPPNSSPLKFLDMDTLVFEDIIKNGQLKVVRYFHEFVGPIKHEVDAIDVSYYTEAFEKQFLDLCVQHDQVEILRYAVETIGFHVHDMMLVRSALLKGPDSACYQYLRSVPNIDEWFAFYIQNDDFIGVILPALIEGGHDEIVATQTPDFNVIVAHAREFLTSAVASNSLSMFQLVMNWLILANVNVTFSSVLQCMLNTNRRGTAEMLHHCRELDIDDRNAYTEEIVQRIGDRQNVAMLEDYVYAYCPRHGITPDLSYFPSMYDDENGHRWCRIGAIFARNRDVIDRRFLVKCVNNEWIDVLKIVLAQRLSSADALELDVKKQLYAAAANTNNLALIEMLHTHPYTKLTSGQIHGSPVVISAFATSSLAARQLVLRD